MAVLNKDKFKIVFLLSLAFFLFLPSHLYAKAGGMGSGNVTEITGDNSQSFPTCGAAGTCHTDGPLNFSITTNITVDAPSQITIDELATITVSMSLNETNDEIGCMLMNQTNGSNLGNWSWAIGFQVVSVNATGGQPNYYENATGNLSYTYTVTSNTTGIANLTLQCRGGLQTGGQQDWLENYDIDIEVLPIARNDTVHVHFTSDPPSWCYFCEIWVHWSNRSQYQEVNYSIDGGAWQSACISCTDAHIVLNTGLDNGTHNVTINTTDLGNVTKNFIVRNLSAIIPEIWNHSERNITGGNTDNYFDRLLGGDLMANEMLFLTVITAGLLIMGFKTRSPDNIPFFGMAGILFLVWGLWIRNQTPFEVFGSDIGGTDIGLFNLAAMWTMFLMTTICVMYSTFGAYREVRRRQRR
jgi:hypothetical protein